MTSSSPVPAEQPLYARPLLEVSDLKCHFAQRQYLLGGRRVIQAVDGVSFTIEPATTLALVGESGCGKSTIGRLIVGLLPQTSGEIRFQGVAKSFGDMTQQRAFCRKIQLVFQNPLDALDPRIKVGEQIAEPLDIHGLLDRKGRQEKAFALAAELGLEQRLLGRFPHELSGGQLQRVVIARALVLDPQLIVCDEPLSALDVSIQAQTIALLKQRQRATGVAYLFITHDLRVIRQLADRIAVMYLGQLVEEGPVAAVLNTPKHPYTRALVASVPRLKGQKSDRQKILVGEPPAASEPPSGCRFHPRCPISTPRCQVEAPGISLFQSQHRVACHAATDDSLRIHAVAQDRPAQRGR